MRQEKLMDAMEFVDDQLLESAANSMEGKKKSFPWVKLAGYAACLAVIIGLFWHFYIPPVPEYENALFSASQLADLFPTKDTYGGTNVYTTVAYPNEAMFTVPEPPEAAYLNAYQRDKSVTPSKEELTELIDTVFPMVEKMYDTDISSNYGFTQSKLGGYYSGAIEAGGKTVRAVNNRFGLYVCWYNADFSPLTINGKRLSAKTTQTDEEIMQTVSTIIPYLEHTFGLELSAYNIQRFYNKNNPDSGRLEVWLYSEAQVTDEMLEQYGSDPPIYCTGDMLLLEFDCFNHDDAPGSLQCDEISYHRSTQHRYETYTQCRMISLKEAELLLAHGYVFADHVCPLCMAAQDEIDFRDYDRVSLEYWFGYENDSSGIPFYTFYKKLSQKDDGSVVYAKTMVPAIEVSGLKEYFNEQKKHHRAW